MGKSRLLFGHDLGYEEVLGIFLDWSGELDESGEPLEWVDLLGDLVVGVDL